MGDFEDEMRLIFSDEANDMLQKWESINLSLSKEVKDELLQELFRLAHNLKGGSRAVGLVDFGDFVHKVEDGITLLRDKEVHTTAKIISLLLRAHKIMTEMILKARDGSNEKVEFESFFSDYEKAFELSAQIEKNIDATPSAAMFEDDVKADDLISTNLFQEEVSKKVEEIHVGQEVIKKVENYQLNIEPKKIKNETLETNKLSKNNNQETIRIPTTKLDQLTAVIGELSIHQSILWHLNSDLKISNKVFLNSLQIGQKLTKELYDRALGLRMQPIQSIFQRLERNILELSQNLKKEVEVIMLGSDVELDKLVLEKMMDPLTHIVRNAIDHGIENQIQRNESGKSAKGTITISAKQESSGVLIVVSDDGKGLAQNKILKKAQEKGLVSETAALSRDQIFSLILLPGFSTAETITDLSGRGVGMDVVSKTIEQLRGSIKIESEEGRGSSFMISLPTSLSIIDGLIIKLNSQLYVVPVDSIEEVINAVDCELDEHKTMIRLRQNVIPVQKLSHILKNRNSGQVQSSDPNSCEGVFLVAKSGREKVAFLVDDVMGQQQIVVRPLNQNISGLKGIMGGTILGNGEPGLIIDMTDILSNYMDKFRGKEIAA